MTNYHNSIARLALGTIGLVGVTTLASSATAAQCYPYSNDVTANSSHPEVIKKINVNPVESATPAYADVDHYACFLTGMGGQFNSAGEGVRIVNQDGYWAVRANWSSGSGVRGTASCVKVSDRSYYTSNTAWTWYQSGGTVPVTIAPTESLKAGHTWNCFLTRIAGKFEGGGEMVKTYRNGSTWYVGGQSSQVGVRAEARCVQTYANFDYSDTVYSVSANQSEGNVYTQMVSAGGFHSDVCSNETNSMTYPSEVSDCFLRRIAGNFDDLHDLIIQSWANIPGVTSNNYWFLTATSTNSSRVYGESTCLSR
jgi:hypothetical protein